jgi:hypothetical protein
MLVELMDVSIPNVRPTWVNAGNLPTLFLGIFDSSKPMLSRNSMKREQVSHGSFQEKSKTRNDHG